MARRRPRKQPLNLRAPQDKRITYLKPFLIKWSRVLDRLSLASMLRSLFPYIRDGCPLCDSPDCFEGACTRTEKTDDGATRPQTSTPCLGPLSLPSPQSLQHTPSGQPAQPTPEVDETLPGQAAQPTQEVEAREETAQWAQTNTWDCVWDFRKITRPSGQVCSATFWRIAYSIAHDPAAKEAMRFMCEHDRVLMKEKSHNGVVWKKGRRVDLGNWIYAALWCAIVVQSDPDSIVKHLVGRWPSLKPTHGLSDKAIAMMGDMIENMLADALCTGPAVPIHVRQQREQLMKSVRDFGDTISSLDRLLVVDGGPPLSCQRSCPWTFGVLTYWARYGDLDQVASIVARMAGSCRHVALESRRPA